MAIVVEVHAIDATFVDACLSLVENGLEGAENAVIAHLEKSSIDCLSKLQGHSE